MIEFAKKLFPINRSLTGLGVIKTLKLIKEKFPKLKIKSIKSGKKVFDWNIPLEWKIKDAFILTPSGKKICDFKKNNLHVVGYSVAINKYLNLNDLKKKIYTFPNNKNAIPYVTSYYKKNWGFCLSENEKKGLNEKGKYKVFIDSKHFKGKLNYGEIIINGKSKKEIFFSTYICHPLMANNEISGPVLLTYLAKWIGSKPRKFSYRFIFIPETIGSIAYIRNNIKNLKKNLFAGYNVTCVGDNRTFSFLPSKYGNSLSDRASLKVLKKYVKKFKVYNWSQRGSDERQYCSPGVDLPVSSIMRSKYGSYKEYHSSLDKIGSVVSNKGLNRSLFIYKKLINYFESNIFPVSTKLCEPFLTKYNLRKTLSSGNNPHMVVTPTGNLLNVLTWCDGKNTIEDISKLNNISVMKTKKIVKILKKNNLIKF